MGKFLLIIQHTNHPPISRRGEKCSEQSFRMQHLASLPGASDVIQFMTNNGRPQEHGRPTTVSRVKDCQLSVWFNGKKKDEVKVISTTILGQNTNVRKAHVRLFSTLESPFWSIPFLSPPSKTL